MAFFQYTARSKDGKVSKGQIEAESKSKALEAIHAQGAIILSIQEVKAKGKTKVARRGRVKIDELVIFSRQLTTLIESGIPIVGSLEILSEQIENIYFKYVIGMIVKDLKEGSSFAGAIKKYPDIFSELYISMVEAAETSGNLSEILDRLSVYLEKDSALRKKVKSALTYPTVVVCMAMAITGFLIIKVVPTFKSIFESLGGQLPLPTQMLITLSDILRASFLYIVILLVAAFFGLKAYIKTPKGREMYDAFLLKMPIFGDIVQKVCIAQFSRTFATLIRSGVPIMGAFDIVGKTSGNKIVENAVVSAKSAIQEGVPISEPLEQSGIFPTMVVRMIAVGEKTGKLEAMLLKIAQFYEEQTEIVVASLTSLIEPLVIGFLGIVVGGIVVSLFLPIIKISSLIGG